MPYKIVPDPTTDLNRLERLVLLSLRIGPASMTEIAERTATKRNIYLAQAIRTLMILNLVTRIDNYEVVYCQTAPYEVSNGK